MSIPSELTALGYFLFLTVIYFIPSLLGSTVSYFIKTKAAPKRKYRRKHKVSSIVGSITVSAVIPAVIVTIVDIFLASKAPDTGIFIGITVLLGAVGDDVTRFFLNLKNIIKIFKAVSGGVADLKELADILEKLEQEKDKEEDDKK